MHDRLKKFGALLAALIIGAVALTACEEEPTTAEKVSAERNKGVDKVRENQPVKPMPWSPTLHTINRWAETWGQEGKVAYVYMKRADGSLDGYYVLDGYPVSYCTSGSPTYDVERMDAANGDADQQVPAPALDSAYYGGCDENRYYGFDAVTGQIIEYTDGYIMTAMLSDQPLPLDNQPEPYISSIEDVKKR